MKTALFDSFKGHWLKLCPTKISQNFIHMHLHALEQSTAVNILTINEQKTDFTTGCFLTVITQLFKHVCIFSFEREIGVSCFSHYMQNDMLPK